MVSTYINNHTTIHLCKILIERLKLCLFFKKKRPFRRAATGDAGDKKYGLGLKSNFTLFFETKIHTSVCNFRLRFGKFLEKIVGIKSNICMGRSKKCR